VITLLLIVTITMLALMIPVITETVIILLLSVMIMINVPKTTAFLKLDALIQLLPVMTTMLALMTPANPM
jgi:hypothetical protein